MSGISPSVRNLRAKFESPNQSDDHQAARRPLPIPSHFVAPRVSQAVASFRNVSPVHKDGWETRGATKEAPALQSIRSASFSRISSPRGQVKLKAEGYTPPSFKSNIPGSDYSKAQNLDSKSTSKERSFSASVNSTDGDGEESVVSDQDRTSNVSVSDQDGTSNVSDGAETSDTQSTESETEDEEEEDFSEDDSVSGVEEHSDVEATDGKERQDGTNGQSESEANDLSDASDSENETGKSSENEESSTDEEESDSELGESSNTSDGESSQEDRQGISEISKNPDPELAREKDQSTSSSLEIGDEALRDKATIKSRPIDDGRSSALKVSPSSTSKVAKTPSKPTLFSRRNMLRSQSLKSGLKTSHLHSGTGLNSPGDLSSPEQNDARYTKQPKKSTPSLGSPDLRDDEVSNSSVGGNFNTSNDSFTLENVDQGVNHVGENSTGENGTAIPEYTAEGKHGTHSRLFIRSRHEKPVALSVPHKQLNSSNKNWLSDRKLNGKLGKSASEQHLQPMLENLIEPMQEMASLDIPPGNSQVSMDERVPSSATTNGLFRKPKCMKAEQQEQSTRKMHGHRGANAEPEPQVSPLGEGTGPADFNTVSQVTKEKGHKLKHPRSTTDEDKRKKASSTKHRHEITPSSHRHHHDKRMDRKSGSGVEHDTESPSSQTKDKQHKRPSSRRSSSKPHSTRSTKSNKSLQKGRKSPKKSSRSSKSVSSYDTDASDDVASKSSKSSRRRKRFPSEFEDTGPSNTVICCEMISILLVVLLFVLPVGFLVLANRGVIDYTMLEAWGVADVLVDSGVVTKPAPPLTPVKVVSLATQAFNWVWETSEVAIFGANDESSF